MNFDPDQMIGPDDVVVTEDLDAVAADLSSSKATARVVIDIMDELERAEAKFPNQHLPNGTPAYAERIGLDRASDQARRTADMYRKVTNTAVTLGTLTWRHVLAEEFFEALAEHDPAKLRAELIQVAAMSVRWIKDIDLGPDRETGQPA